MKVAFNARYGGFSISMKCAEVMAGMGSDEAQKMLKQYEDDGICQWWYGTWEGTRHDPILIRAIEMIGYGSGHCDTEWVSEDRTDQQIKIYKLKHGTRYIIHEYDGLESVVEPEDVKWIDTNE